MCAHVLTLCSSCDKLAPHKMVAWPTRQRSSWQTGVHPGSRAVPTLGALLPSRVPCPPASSSTPTLPWRISRSPNCRHSARCCSPADWHAMHAGAAAGRTTLLVLRKECSSGAFLRAAARLLPVWQLAHTNAAASTPNTQAQLVPQHQAYVQYSCQCIQVLLL